MLFRSKEDVERWSVKRAAGCKPRTYNIDLETLQLILRYAVEKGMILESPAEGFKRRKLGKAAVIIPDRKQFSALLETMHDCRKLTKSVQHRAEAANLVEFLAYSGCRLGEALSVRWRDVSFDLMSVTITGGETGTKNHEARTIPLFPALAQFLTRYKEAIKPEPKADDLLFALLSGKKAIETGCRRLGLPKFHHHTFRHFFCSNAIEARIDFKTIAEWLGHKDGGVLVARTYGHLRNEHSTAMAKLMTFDGTVPTETPANVVPMSAAVNS